MPVNTISSLKSGSPSGSSSAIKMDELNHAEATRKAHALGVPSISSSPSLSLTGKVTEGKKPIPLQEIMKALSEQPNYLNELRETVALILAQISRISEKDKAQIDELKRSYTKTYETSAGLTQQIAWNGLIWSGFALVPLLLLTSGNPLDRDVGTACAREFVPKLGEMWNSHLPAQKARADGYGAVLNQEWSAKSGKTQSDGNNKDQITNLLSTAMNTLKEAARSG